MDDARRFQLLFGPYRMPARCRVGSWLTCGIRGKVRVTAISDGPIQWPMTCRAIGGGRPFLIVCGDLARAIKRESAIAICHWWGVKPTTVWVWRKELGVPQGNEGTRALHRDWFPEVSDEEEMERWHQANRTPEKAAKISAAKNGKPRPKEVMDRLHRGNIGRKHSDESRRRMSEAQLRRVNKYAVFGPLWTAAEDALLGTMLDREVAAQIGRSLEAVNGRRRKLGIPRYKSRGVSG